MEVSLSCSVMCCLKSFSRLFTKNSDVNGCMVCVIFYHSFSQFVCVCVCVCMCPMHNSMNLSFIYLLFISFLYTLSSSH